MELKNQILLVILIPIILILILAVLQVGLLGFVSIPSFQDSLLEFHINRHLNGLQIEMNIIQQEIYIQYQAYYNQIFGVSAHLRHYCFGEFQNFSSWTLNTKQIAPYSFSSGQITEEYYTVAWSHSNYSKLEALHKGNPRLSFLINKITQSLILSDIIINNTRSSSQDKQLVSKEREDDSRLIPITYDSIMVHCTDSLVVRIPQFTQKQQNLLKNINTADWLPKERFKLDSTLNFSMSYVDKDEFTQNPSLTITQIISSDNFNQCFMTAKISNSYLEDLITRHYQQHKIQGESEHQFFIAIINDEFINLAPKDFSNIPISESIIKYIVKTKDFSQSSYNSLNKDLAPQIMNKSKELVQNTTLNSTSLTYSFGQNKFYLLFSKVNIYSTKKVSIVTAPENGRRYVYIEPEENNFIMPSFILVHYFEEQTLIQELYEGTSLNNVRMLEIIVFIVIIALSVVIFIFVWYTAGRIGLSFEQPIKVLTDFMNSIDIQNMDQEEELINYQDYFNSFEIKSLFQTMNIFVTTIKYSNQKYSNSKHSDALALMELSKAKDFYKKEIGNMSAVGICANNIGILHMKGGRVFEAINEMEEAIYIAKLELIEIKELKKWCLGMQSALQEPNLYQNFKQRLKGLAQKFKEQMKINWIGVQINNNNNKTKKQNSQLKLNSQSLVNKPKEKHNKNQSTTQLLQKNSIPHVALLNTGTQNKITQNQTNSIQTPINKKRMSFAESRQHMQPINSVEIENSPNITPQLSPNVSINRLRNLGSHSYNQSSIISQRLDLKESIIQQDERYRDEEYRQDQEERIRGDSRQSTGGMTELQMIEEKITELMKKKKLAKAKLLNRQFQLAQFMFTICMQNEIFIPETLKLFNEFEATAEKEQQFTQSNIVRLLNLHVKKALCYIQIGDLSNFKISQKKALEYYNKLNENFIQEQNQIQEDYNFVDMFKNVPKEVLLSKIMQLQAIYELIEGNFKTGSEILTQIIELGEYYDPEVRDFCLTALEKIINLFSISPLPIQQFRNQISINTYEIVFMIDYSKEMSIEQINLSHSICNRIFHILQPQDLIGMYGFNNSLHEAFPLQPKGTYKDLLTKQLFMAITAPGGKSKIFQALKYSVKNFFEHKITINDNDYDKKQNQNLNDKQKMKLLPVAEEDEEKSLIEENIDDKNKHVNFSQEYQYDLNSESDSEFENDDFQFIKNEIDYSNITENEKSQQKNDFRTSYKFICIFTEINNKMSEKQFLKLRQVLEKNQVDLMVFNIANQNANMLELKRLSKITKRSIFVNATANLEQLFGKSRQHQLQKKMYLEFF
ncbi:unnamed protein product [Paramecium primaurelia]|uniref:VWFA domain-containing protein n=1 Tax=Paramecium primaurelia TaxID=5886 RepID=A0A8S1LJM7_PARPR|nr:unnamed protein product [Paramecium primaurelia]